MRIVEIFPTIQGEGRNLGVPSLFIRTGGCNLRCQFRGEACDTPYSVFTPKELDEKNPSLKHGYEAWETYSVDELVDIISKQKLQNIVWTGGEPMLYQKEILEVVQKLRCGKHHFTHEIETNGTIAVITGLWNYHNMIFNVSVKLSSSNQEDGYDKKRIDKDSLESFPLNRTNYKFVITDPVKDLIEINEILDIKKHPAYCMPEGQTREAVLSNSQLVVDLCIKEGFRFTPREHINIWDTKKGV